MDPFFELGIFLALLLFYTNLLMVAVNIRWSISDSCGLKLFVRPSFELVDLDRRSE
jgi:hypothetical protein